MQNRSILKERVAAAKHDLRPRWRRAAEWADGVIPLRRNALACGVR
jgi:hypothetical protein